MFRTLTRHAENTTTRNVNSTPSVYATAALGHFTENTMLIPDSLASEFPMPVTSAKETPIPSNTPSAAAPRS